MSITTARLLKAEQVSAIPSRGRISWSEFSETTTSPSFAPLDILKATSHSMAQPTTIATEHESLHTVLSALDSAAKQFLTQRDNCLEQCQTESVKLGIAIAEKLLRRVIANQPDCVLELVRNTLQWTDGQNSVRVRLNSKDCELVEQHLEDLVRKHDQRIELIADEQLTRGDCVVEASNSLIDARIETLLSRITEELLA